MTFSTTNRTTRNQICFIIGNIPTTTNIPCNQSAYFINKSHNSHIMQLSSTTTSTTCNHTIHIASCITTTSTQIWGGIFIFLISIKNFPPPYAIVIIYNLLTNKWLECGIIRWWECDDVKNCHIIYG